MSLEDNQNIYQSISCKLEFGRRVRGGVVGRGRWRRTRATWWCTWHGGVTCRTRRFRTRVQLVMDRAVFIWVRDDKELPFTSDLSAPRKQKQTLVENWQKRRLEGLYCFNCIFQLTYEAFKKSALSQFYLYSFISICLWGLYKPNTWHAPSFNPRFKRRRNLRRNLSRERPADKTAQRIGAWKKEVQRNACLPLSTILICSTHSLASWGLLAVNWWESGNNSAIIITSKRCIYVDF